MRKFSLLVLSCFLLPNWLLADPVVFTITSLTASFSGGGPRTTFSGSGFSDSGDSITIGGSGGQALPSDPIFPGDPIGSTSYGLIGNCSGAFPPCSQPGGIADIGGRFFIVQLLPATLLGTQVFEAPNNLTFQPPTLTYVVAATVKGDAIAVCSQDFNCADGTVIGDLLIDLPGYDTIHFLGPPNISDYHFDGATFDSTPIPEPSSILLILLGSIAVMAAVRETAHCWSATATSVACCSKIACGEFW